MDTGLLEINAVMAHVASQRAFAPRMPNKANHAEMQQAVSTVLRITRAQHQAVPAKRHRSRVAVLVLLSMKVSLGKGIHAGFPHTWHGGICTELRAALCCVLCAEC